MHKKTDPNIRDAEQERGEESQQVLRIAEVLRVSKCQNVMCAVNSKKHLIVGFNY